MANFSNTVGDQKVTHFVSHQIPKIVSLFVQILEHVRLCEIYGS